MSSEGVEVNVKNYIKEFGKSGKHVSIFYNKIYSIFFYIDEECIDILDINIPKVDFGSCKQKVLDTLGSTNKIVFALVAKVNEDKTTSTLYSFYNAETGVKIDAENICKEDVIIVNKNVLSKLNNSETIDLNTILFLTEQDIDIFNLSGAFYNDICFHFESPNGKDVPLQDRVQAFYPNVSLCDNGCTNKGVNLTTMESICECKFVDIMNNDLIEGNILIKETFGEVADLLGNSNLDVLQCFKDVFKSKYIKKNAGGFIILSMIILEILCFIFFYLFSYKQIISYLFYLSEYFASIIQNKKNDDNASNIIKDNNSNSMNKKEIKLICPPKKMDKKTIEI